MFDRDLQIKCFALVTKLLKQKATAENDSHQREYFSLLADKVGSGSETALNQAMGELLEVGDIHEHYLTEGASE